MNKKIRSPWQLGCFAFLVVLGIVILLVAVALLLSPSMLFSINPSFGTFIAILIDYGFWAALAVGVIVFFWARSRPQE